MRRFRLLSIAVPILLLPLLVGCPSKKEELPAGASYRAGDKVVRVVAPGEVEIREKGERFHAAVLVEGNLVRITTDAGKLVELRLVPEGLEGEGKLILFSTEERRKRSAAVRERMAANVVQVPAGNFLMGSGSAEPDELPPHKVSLVGFLVSKYEVTQEEWSAVMLGNPSATTGEPGLPVENVSFEDCQEFLRELNELEGRKLWRLPTEAEWEYAARGGSAALYEFGDDPAELPKRGWFAANAGGRSHPVGKLLPNAFGLYDVHGNVWEWCQDWYGGYAPVAVSAPEGPSEGSLRVRRGGGWGNDAKACRAGKRDGGAPSAKNSDLGLRLVRIGK